MTEPDTAETETRILDAAHAVFLRRGTAGARMQEIADEAGVNKALLHYYFRSKENLAQAVFRRAFQTLLPGVLAILRSERRLEEKVEAVVAAYLDTLLENPFLPGYLLGELTHAPERVAELFESLAGFRAEQMSSQVLGVLARQLEEEARAGRLRAITPEEFVMNLVSLTIFPFAARPLLSLVLQVDDAGFRSLMERRKRTLPEYIMKAMRP